MPSPSPARSPRSREIVFVAFDGMQALDLTGPWEVLHSAGRLARHAFELTSASLDGSPVRSSSGLRLGVDRRLGDVGAPNTLIVPGGSGTRQAQEDPALIAEVARLSGSARRTAGIDLALALVEEEEGREVALEVARWLVVYARRSGGQAQFSVQLAHQAAATAPLQELQGWIAEHLDADLSVAGLAARVHLSERQLTRRFRSELGASPADYVEQARLERARALLEEGSGDLGTVASRCGFASPEVMRRVFHRRLGISPRQYRDRFQTATAA